MPSKITDLTPIGKRILAVLETDARATQTEIAERVDVSTTTVKNHIQKLEEDGVIVGYSVDVNPKKLSERQIAIVGINIESARFSDVLNECEKFDEIKRLYIASGDHMLIVELRAADTVELNTLLSDRLLGIEGIVDVHPTILHDRLK
jgi:Lrp/AsnC family transcriptional regulator for asnA, asnC and gidA